MRCSTYNFKKEKTPLYNIFYCAFNQQFIEKISCLYSLVKESSKAFAIQKKLNPICQKPSQRQRRFPPHFPFEGQDCAYQKASLVIQISKHFKTGISPMPVFLGFFQLNPLCFSSLFFSSLFF